MLTGNRIGRVLGCSGALVCLTAYLLGGVGLLPQVLAFGAWLEGSHTVYPSVTAGQIEIVLSHEHHTPGPRHDGGPQVHRHGPTARVICLFVTQTGSKDHAASFAITPICEKPSIPTKVKTKPYDPIPTLAGAMPSHQQCVIGLSKFPIPPAPSSSFHLLCSTVLLI